MDANTLIRRGSNGVFGIEAKDLMWIEASRPGLRLAAVSEDRRKGKFLGYIGFEPLASTGLHQHLDIAFSYFVDGGLTDYQGAAVTGDMGINLKGATHDAIAYRKTLAAARLEGPVLYEGPGNVAGPALHSGAKVAPIVNEAPEVMPDNNIPVALLPAVSTAVAGISRRLIYDYHKVAREGRSVQLQFLPGSATPPFEATAPISFFVIGGALDIGGIRIGGGGFGIVDEGTPTRLASGFGALVLAWAEGPARWLDQKAPDLFGF
ncbi:MAG: cupin domain-containing protein [Hyphomicrobiales bacterium]